MKLLQQLLRGLVMLLFKMYKNMKTIELYLAGTMKDNSLLTYSALPTGKHILSYYVPSTTNSSFVEDYLNNSNFYQTMERTK